MTAVTPDDVVASAPVDHVVTWCSVEDVVAGSTDDRVCAAGRALRCLRRAGGQGEGAEKDRDAASGGRQTEGSLVHDDVPF